MVPVIEPLLVTLLTPPDRVMPASGGASKPGLPPSPWIVPALVIVAAPFSTWMPDSLPSIVASAALSMTAVSSRSEEHTSELQSLMRISYAVFCLKKKKINNDATEAASSQHRNHKHTLIH